MKKAIPSTAIPTHALKSEALAGMTASFDRFCLAAGIETLSEMTEQDAEAICGSRHARGEGRQADRWGRRKGRIGFHGGKVDVERPRVRGLDGEERILPSWKSAVGENWLGEWAMNPMLIAVSTRKLERSVRLPGGDVPAPRGAGLSKSATSRRFVALSAARMRQWMATRLDHLDLMVIQIDGVHMADDMLLFRGANVYPSQVQHSLLEVVGTGVEFKIVLERTGALDHATVLVERDPGAAPADIDHFVADLKERVRHKLKNDTAVNFEVDILSPNTLERALSKAKRVDDRRPKYRPGGH